jgi:hypothetical protein
VHYSFPLISVLPNAMALNSLPIEILTEIVGYLEADSWKNMRLVSKSLTIVATRHLFETVTLTPTDQSIECFEKLSRNSILGGYAKRIIVETFPEISFDQQSWNNHFIEDDLDDWEAPKSFIPVFTTLSKYFPAVNALELKFSADVGNGNVYLYDSREPPELRAEVLEAFFREIATRSKEKTLKGIESLTIVNLSDYAHDELATSSSFLEVVKSLKEFHTHVAIEGDSAAPEHEHELPEFTSFMPHLRSRWLEPMANHLTALSIYFESYWGAVPYFDVEGLNLPNLRYLALGNYTFAHEKQISWLTSLTLLETLSLDDSPLVIFCDFCEKSDIDTGNWRVIPYEGQGDSYFVAENLARWSHYFDEIRLKLCNLKSFQFGHGDWNGAGVSLNILPQLLVV